MNKEKKKVINEKVFTFVIKRTYVKVKYLYEQTKL